MLTRLYARASTSVLLMTSLLMSGVITPRALASTAPTTPTFMLAWGNLGDAPGQFNNATYLATDAAGHVYVADLGNNRIQLFDFLGNCLLRWGSPGSGNGQFSQPTGIAISDSGSVYVADAGNSRVQKFDAAGTFVLKWGTSGAGNGQFSSPDGIAVDRAGNVYVADSGHNRIEKFSSNGAYLAQWGSSGAGTGQFNVPRGIAIDHAGNVLVVDENNTRVQQFTNAGAYLSQWGSTGAGNGQFNNPIGISVDAIGNVYVADLYNNRVQKFDRTGTYLTQWGAAGTGNGQFTGLFGVAVDAAGNVYTTETFQCRVQKFSGAGAQVAQQTPAPIFSKGGMGSGIGQFLGPAGIATDSDGNYYVADTGNGRIQVFSSTGAYIRQWGSPGSGSGQFGVGGPTGLAIDVVGNLYAADTGNNRIEKFTAAGVLLNQYGGLGSGNGQFHTPAGVTTDAVGNVYVADQANHRIQKFSDSGTYLSQWGSNGTGNGQFSFPSSIVISPLGNIYVLDSGNSRVQEFSSTGSYITQWGSFGIGHGQFFNPFGIAVDFLGNVYVDDGNNSRIQKFTGFGTYLTSWGGAEGSTGIAVDPAGSVYVAERDSDLIKKYATPPVITMVSDVGNDQGRQVRLRFQGDSGDAFGSGFSLPITGYAVYRRIDPLPVPDTSPSAGGAIGNISSFRPTLDGWDYVGTQPASGDVLYSMVVPTLADANTSTEYTTFLVRALTSDPVLFFYSWPEYGYSLDNLSPPAPSPFTGAYIAGATHLHWGVSAASDFATFRLYRGATSSFTPALGNLVTATTDTAYADVGAAGSYYKLSAVDFNGNESPYGVLSPSQTTGVDGPSPLAFALEGAWPNPASVRKLSVRFVLPVASSARLELLDVAGRRLARRDVGAMGVGEHAVNLAEAMHLRPGLYWIQLTQGANRKVARVTVLEN